MDFVQILKIVNRAAKSWEKITSSWWHPVLVQASEELLDGELEAVMSHAEAAPSDII